MFRVIEHDAKLREVADGARQRRPPQGERRDTEPIYVVGAHVLNPNATPAEEETERALDEDRRRAREDLKEKVGGASWWKDPKSPEDRLGPFRVQGGYRAVVVVVRGVQKAEDEKGEGGEGGQ